MALTAYAAKTKPELEGTAAQRKLAGLRDITETYLASPHCPTQHGRTPTVRDHGHLAPRRKAGAGPAAPMP